MQNYQNLLLTLWGRTHFYDLFSAGEAASANFTPIHLVQLQPVILVESAEHKYEALMYLHHPAG
jgi:hypothetical protein